MTGSPQSGLRRLEIEQRVGAIWAEVLGMREGQEGATFFDLLGQSISAVRIIARIEDELGLTIDVGILFEDPNLPTFKRKVTAAYEEAGDLRPQPTH